MNQESRNTLTPGGGEVKILDVFHQIKTGWRYLIGGTFIGLMAAVGFLYLVPPQFESTAVVQSATLGNGGLSKTPLEPATQTLERLKLTTFYSDQIVKACQAESPRQLSQSVNSLVIKGNALILIRYRANSPAIAELCVSKIVDRLVQSQSEIAVPLINVLKEQHTITKKQIENLERFLAQYDKNISQTSAEKETASILYLNAESKREELLKLQKLYYEQQTLLTEPLTQPLKLLERVYVSEKAVFPKKLLSLVVGAFNGFFAGLVCLIIVRVWRRSVRSLG